MWSCYLRLYSHTPWFYYSFLSCSLQKQTRLRTLVLVRGRVVRVLYGCHPLCVGCPQSRTFAMVALLLEIQIGELMTELQLVAPLFVVQSVERRRGHSARLPLGLLGSAPLGAGVRSSSCSGAALPRTPISLYPVWACVNPESVFYTIPPQLLQSPS